LGLRLEILLGGQQKLKPYFEAFNSVNSGL